MSSSSLPLHNSRMRLLCVSLLASLLLSIGESQITVMPTGNQTAPAGSDVNITYTCTVPAGSIVEWGFGNVQLSPGSLNAQLLADNGLLIDPPTEAVTTMLIVTRSGRENLSDNIQLRCSALRQSDVTITFGEFFYVRTFSTPNPPQNFAFNPFPSDTSRLILSWDQPDNTLIDEDDPVTTTYTVTVTGPTFNFTETTTNTSYEFRDDLDEPCAMHDFFVSASNAAGQGMNVTRQETIPISPDIRALDNSLTVSRIDLSGGGVAVDVTFTAATICSPNFPLVRYEVTVTIDEVTEIDFFPVTDNRIVGQGSITLPVPSDMLEQDREYDVTVSACITVTCRTTSPVPFRTTDVQSASITFFETNVFLECTFSNVIAGLGCAFRLTIASGDVETITVPVDEGFRCSMTLNMQNAYMSIEAVDWESEMVFGTATTQVTINPMITGADNYTMMTGCVLPTPAPSLSGGAIAGITIAVILFVLLILAVVIVIAVVEYQRRTRKLPKIKRHDEEKVSVDFDKQWLMEDHELPKRRGSLKRGRSIVDGAEETSIAFTSRGAGGPPTPSASLAQPSLTNPTAAFTLHINRHKQKAHLHLNRALIRQVLKEKRMSTLEKKAARSKPNQPLREFLLPLPSEIRVTGEDSDEDAQHDGEDGGEADNMIAQL